RPRARAARRGRVHGRVARRVRRVPLRVTRVDRHRDRAALRLPRLRRPVARRRIRRDRRPGRPRAASPQHPPPARGQRAAVLRQAPARRPMRRLAGVVALVVAGAAGLTVGAGAAHAATWCGTTTTQDRPPALTGRSIHVIYAYPSDGSERSAQLASQLSADVDAIDGWWLAQDPAREPRFDRVAFACGLQADILSLRLSDTAATLQSSAVRGDRVEAQASA